MKTLRTYPINLMLILWLLILLAACNSRGKEKEADTNEATSGEQLLTMSVEQIKANGLILGKITEYEFVRKVPATGYLDVLPQNRQEVSSWLGGTVKGLSLLPGDFVKAGQILCRLENPELVIMQEEYLTAAESLRFLEDDYERQKQLASENVAAQKTYLKARAEYLAAQAKTASLQTRLKMLNIIPPDEVKDGLVPYVSISSPITGYITDVEAHNGSYINESAKILTIVQPSPLILDLSVFEKDILMVKEGQEVSFSLPGISGDTYLASVLKVGKAVNGKRTISVQALFLPPDSVRLMPGMYVSADIHTAKRKAPALPVTAILSSEDQNFVLVKTNQDVDVWKLDKKRVETGWQDEKMIEIAEDFVKQLNGEVVVAGAFSVSNK